MSNNFLWSSDRTDYLCFSWNDICILWSRSFLWYKLPLSIFLDNYCFFLWVASAAMPSHDTFEFSQRTRPFWHGQNFKQYRSIRHFEFSIHLSCWCLVTFNSSLKAKLDQFCFTVKVVVRNEYHGYPTVHMSEQCFRFEIPYRSCACPVIRRYRQKEKNTKIVRTDWWLRKKH